MTVDKVPDSSKMQRPIIGPASPKQQMMLRNETNIAIWGGAVGSGKSYIALMCPLKYANDPHFRGLIFRKTNNEIRGLGGLWDTAQEMYYSIFGKDKLKVNQQQLKITFPSGASIKFSYLEKETDKEKHRGQQYTFVLFDRICRLIW